MFLFNASYGVASWYAIAIDTIDARSQRGKRELNLSRGIMKARTKKHTQKGGRKAAC